MQGGDRVMDRLTKLFILSLIINISEKICFVTCILMLAFGVVRLLSERIFLRVYDSKEDN